MDTNLSFHYKYIVLSYGYDYYDYVYRQFKDCEYAVYSHELKFPSILEPLFYHHMSAEINLFKEKWVNIYIYIIDKYVRLIAKNNERICFVLLGGGKNNVLLHYGLTDKLREKYKESKIVFFISDLVLKTKQPIQLMKEKADLVISFDPGDAKRYDILNHIIPYSDYKFKNEEEIYDVAFVGAAKDRLDELISIHRNLVNNGVKSHFHIINAPIDKQIAVPGIVYSGFISYEENINILSKSRCIIDIVQKEGKGNTIRVGEAIIMGKKLLTNNTYTPYNGVYDERFMQVFTDSNDINLDFIKDKTKPNYTIKEKMYPVNLLRFIESRI